MQCWRDAGVLNTDCLLQSAGAGPGRDCSATGAAPPRPARQTGTLDHGNQLPGDGGGAIAGIILTR